MWISNVFLWTDKKYSGYMRLLHVSKNIAKEFRVQNNQKTHELLTQKNQSK
jgi:hypothetical protein